MFDLSLPPEEEHVVGRKFVPKNSLAGQWNLIANACGGCNDEKSELENDLSAILMQPDVTGQSFNDLMANEAERKETARSKRTGKAVVNGG